MLIVDINLLPSYGPIVMSLILPFEALASTVAADVGVDGMRNTALELELVDALYCIYAVALTVSKIASKLRISEVT